MFYLSEIEHTLRLPPHLLNLALNEAIKGELEGLFVDKVSISSTFVWVIAQFMILFSSYLLRIMILMQVIAQLGLCISVYDIRSIDGGFIFPGDGASTYTVLCVDE